MTNYSFKNVLMKAMFTSTVYKIFLFKGRLVLSSVQQGAGKERVSQFINFGSLDDYWSKLKKNKVIAGYLSIPFSILLHIVTPFL